ncbi:hypothetical protein RB1012 [Rhodopirellula baltica SH 1]|uniref:Uncharacterized protein n=1 Tax=Rhodopirellula baltica (strain DSM 10527 / NCIMB 13988 / SH1) TaxID=243090 RepID=Q7UXY5_RHOBA|nr:hypothetical protein RB1012 [Rhodopirellula baltica SH 1]
MGTNSPTQRLRRLQIFDRPCVRWTSKSVDQPRLRRTWKSIVRKWLGWTLN